ncbi:MAG: hypothetical protein AAFP70_00345 [Calditrichota bacterium]
MTPATMSTDLLQLTFIAVLAGAILGALIGGYYGKKIVVDLADLAQPISRRIRRGATIGTIFGAFIVPKITAVTYVVYLLFSR